MRPFNKSLKTKLLILSMVFPLSFSFINFFMGYYFYGTTMAIILGFLGIILGILLDLVCYYRKLFTIFLYQTPIPLVLFLLVWWISNTFVNDLFALFFAIGGLLIGLWLNSELIMPFQFYRIKKRILGIIYFFFSIVLLGFFMGIPVFNLLLGFLAGNYLSIRVISNYKIEHDINKDIKQGAVYTSLVLFIITTIALLIALSDMESSMQMAHQILNIPLNASFFIFLIVAGGIIIIIIQYYITLFTAKTMLQLWKHRRFSRYIKQ